MKVYLSKYRYHWLSPYTILEKVFFWREIEYDEPIIDKWSDRLTPFCQGIQSILDFIHPKIDYVKIDKWDTWSMDYTLSHIIVPMLKQLQETKHGAPFVDDEDVPEELKSTSAPPKETEYDTDENHFKRWDWAIAEMIWAFEQNLDTNSEEKFFDHAEWDEKEKDFGKNLHKIKIDQPGLKAHQARKANGFRLFGKYYSGLWD
jgi:hypothetical protein